MKTLLALLLFLPCCLFGQSIHIATVHDTVCAGNNVFFYAAASGLVQPHYQWLLNGANTGGDSATCRFDSLQNMDKVSCILLDSLGSVKATSDTITITTEHNLNPGIITGPDSVCQGATITLTDTVANGVWSASRQVDSIPNGVFKVPAFYSEFCSMHDTFTIYYMLSNSCGAFKTQKVLTSMPKPHAGFCIGYNNGYICMGDNQPCNLDAPLVCGGRLFSTTGKVGFGVDVYGLHPGTDYIYNIDSNYCGIDSFGQHITVLPPPSAGNILLPLNNICIGDSIQLTDTGYDGVGTWAISNGNAILLSPSGKLFGFHAGIDTVNFNINAQCGPANTSKIITVLPPPNPGSILLSFSNICIGDSTQLSDTGYTGMGTWSVINGNAIFPSPYIGKLFGIHGGMDTINFTTSTECGSASTSLTINILPPPDAGSILLPSNNVCIGDTLQLVDTGNNGPGTWHLTNNNARLAAPFFDRIMGVQAGLDTVSFNTVTQCGSATVTKTVSILPVPIPYLNDMLLPINSICTGDTIPIIDTGKSWSGVWYLSNRNATRVSPFIDVLIGVGEGKDTVNFNSYTQCGVVNTTKILTIKATPKINVVEDSICTGNTEIAIASINGGKWSAMGGVEIDENAGVVTGVSVGEAAITYAMPTGCSNTQNLFVTKCNDWVTIYPNPVQNKLEIYDATEKYTNCTITNCLGQVMLKQDLSGKQNNIDTKLFLPGVYLLRAWGNGKDMAVKFVKE